MSSSASRRKSKKVRRKSPLDQPIASVVEKRSNKLKRRGYFPSLEIDDAERQHLSFQELKDFFKAIPTTGLWRQYFLIQYIFGCRLSEPALILDEDVSLKKKQIVIRRLKTAQEQEGYREHICAADERVLKAVGEIWAWKKFKGLSHNPFLFASIRQRKEEDVGKTERLSQLRSLDGWQAVSRFTAHRMFVKVAKAAKLPEALQHSHVLRHTRAIVMLAYGAPLEQVQLALGHSSLKMTTRYMAYAEKMKEDLANVKLDDVGLGL